MSQMDYHYHLKNIKDSEIWQKKNLLENGSRENGFAHQSYMMFNYSHLFAHSDSYKHIWLFFFTQALGEIIQRQRIS